MYALLPLIGCLLQENLKRRIWILWSLFFIVGLVLQFMSEFVYKPVSYTHLLLIEAEFEDCSMLPNIHGGLDPLTNGPKLPEGLADKVREIIED